MSTIYQNAAVWFEIPVKDLDRAIAFYNVVFDAALERDETGPNPMAIFPTEPKGGVGGHLYPGHPAGAGTGPTIHLRAPDSLEATMKRVERAGGKVVSPVIEIPAGRFAYALDCDGNSIGLFTDEPSLG